MIHLIINPVAGHGYALRVAKKVEKWLNQHNMAFYAHHTNAVGHATILAQQAVAEGAERVFCICGDGTISEVVQGLLGAKIPLGIIPGGTGNDYARTLNLPKNFNALMELLTGDHMRTVDVGLLNGKAFMNIIGLGFDVEVLRCAERFKPYMRGVLPYLLGVIMTIFIHRDVTVSMAFRGEKRSRRALLVAVANGQSYGGGMKIAAPAVIDDGQLNVIIIYPVKKQRIPFLLPFLLKGNFYDKVELEHHMVNNIVLSGRELYINVDGEVLPIGRARIELARDQLQVFSPAIGV